jgi:hypothetical protein
MKRIREKKSAEPKPDQGLAADSRRMQLLRACSTVNVPPETGSIASTWVQFLP